MRIKRPTESTAQGEINLTPVIDMVFLLLIFFLCATKFADIERDVKIKPPAVRDNRPISAIPQELVINIDPMGIITMGGSERTLEDVDRLLALAIRDNPRQSVVIRADKNTVMQDAVDVLSLCEKHGIDRTYLTTTQTGRK